MAKPYSQDLRDRVLDAVDKDGMSRRAAAERFGVSDSSAIKWVERLERTGLRTAARMGGYKPRNWTFTGIFWRRRGPRSRTSPCRRFATGFWRSAASRRTPR